MIRELINKLSHSLSEKMVPSRRGHTAPMKVWFDPEMNTERAVEAARTACILGETVDLSRSGIAFSVPFIRIKEKYLVNQDRTLNVELDLPDGKVCMRVLGRRYEKIGMHSSAERFLVGASIVSLTGSDKDAYEAYLRNGDRRPHTAAKAFGIPIE